MIKICFVCLGNICRSPMAEFIMKEKIRQKKLEDSFIIVSKATSDEEQGNPIHYGTRNKLSEYQIPYTPHYSTQLEKKDYERYDYFIGMDYSNIRSMGDLFELDNSNKIYRLLDFTEEKRDIIDPWYTGNFEQTYIDIDKGCERLLEILTK